MGRIFLAIIPHPILSVALFIVWLLMNSPFGTGSVVIASLVALLVPHVMRAMAPDRVKVRNPVAILRLAGRVITDALHSNWKVALLILGKRKHERKSGFVRIPLQLSNRYGLAALAIIITSTPGTLWVQYDRYKRVLLLHVLDLEDDDDWSAIVKERYETLLMEIFP